jgi:phospholipase/carboxylesterase
MKVDSTQDEEDFVGLRFVHRVSPDPNSPLVVLVHGRAGNKQVMWTFDRLIPQGCSVVSFEAFLNDAQGGFSWWDVNGKPPLEPAILAACDRLQYALERYITFEGLSPRRVVGVGFSQGAVLLSTAMLTAAVKFDGLGLLAGLVSKAGEQGRVIGEPEVFIAHGISDQIVPVERARRGAERLEALGLRVTYVEEDVGHKVGVEGTRALREWLQRVCLTEKTS